MKVLSTFEVNKWRYEVRYRIRHELRGNGTEYYIPQWKGWIFWHSFCYGDPILGLTHKFDKLLQAVEFIADRKEGDKWATLTNVEYIEV